MPLSASDVDADVELCMSTLNGNLLGDAANLITVLGKRSYAEIKQIDDAYYVKKQRHLDVDIKEKVTGDFEKICLALITEPTTFAAECVNKAVKGLGTDEDLMIQTLLPKDDDELKAIQAKYQLMYSKTISHKCDSELSGNLKTLFKTVLDGRNASGDVTSHVAALYRAGEGKIGTDEKVFVEIIGNYSRAHVQAVATAYEAKHGKSLVSVVKSEFSGDLKHALLALVMPKADYYAMRLLEALDRANTDEDTVTRICVAQRESNLTAISRALAAINAPRGNELGVWISRKTGGNYGKVLNAICACWISSAR